MPNQSTNIGTPYVFEFPFTFVPKYDNITVAGDTAIVIQPPSGEEWVFMGLRCRGDGVNSGKAYLTDGANTASPILHPENGIGDGNLSASSLQNARVFCNNSIYIYIVNDFVAAQSISYDAFECVRSGIAGEVKSDVVAIAADTTADLKPPAGETWLLTAATVEGDGANSGHFGTIIWTHVSNVFLEIDYSIGGGDVNNSCIHNARIFADNTTHFEIHNHKAAPTYFSYSAIRWS